MYGLRDRKLGTAVLKLFRQDVVGSSKVLGIVFASIFYFLLKNQNRH